MKAFSKLVIIGALTAAFGAAFAQTSASTPSGSGTAQTNIDADFAQKHPRIAEVLGRLRNERERIAADLKAGKITQVQAEALLKRAHQIRREELRDVAKHDGTLTKEEQEKLNREEDLLSMRIHHDAEKTAEKKEDRAEKKSESAKSGKK